VSTSGVAQITFTGDPPGAVTGYQCRLDTDVWSPCSSPADYDGLGDGPHRLDVRALGAGGRPDASPAGVSWTIDRTPPRTRIAAAPSLETTTTDAVFALAADEPSTFECSLDGAPWSPCGSVVALHALAPGSHTLAARATDAAGLVDASPALYSWRVLVTSAQPVGAVQPPEGQPESGGNPFVAAPPVQPLPWRGRLTVSRARLDRRGRIVLTLVCRAARCTGRLSLRDRGRAIGSATVQVPRGATRTVAIRAQRRPRTITLALSGQGTSLERSSVRLQR
jgi:hypothetical protein